MTVALTERLVTSIGARFAERRGTSRRGFLGGAALVGAALTVDPFGFLTQPASAYDAVCGDGAGCNDGWSAFCCTINGGRNSCPPHSFVGGWWKADNSSFCGGAARYYIDCNAYKGDPTFTCHCASGSCDQRRVACNQFRYGQCSLDVSAAQTGPVVCRMISCTPPWQQFAGVCVNTSATDNATASHTAPCLAGTGPVGSLDGAVAAGSGIRVTGWAFDPDEPGTQIQVAVYVDSKGFGWFPTGRARSDVNSAYGITGNHGYDVTVPVGPGRHTVYVFGINVAGGGNTLLGSRVLQVGGTALPVGALDSIAAAPDSTIRIRGWAYDADDPAMAISVAVYLDGRGVSWFPTGRPRADVNSVFRITGNHGFDITFTSPPGEHLVEVWAIDSRGGTNRLFGRGRTTVGLPTGVLDSAGTAGGTVRLRGWGYDPDQPGSPINIAVYRDSGGLGWHQTTVNRPDVNAVYGLTGTHGFDLAFPGQPAGRHAYHVFAINAGPSAPNRLIASTTLEV